MPACVASKGNDTDGSSPTSVCERYIECVANTAPSLLADTQAAYGRSGTCWQMGDFELCETACQTGLVAQSVLAPDEPSCAQCTSNAECSDGQLCDMTQGVCVECLSDDDCTDPASPVCRIETRSCGEEAAGTTGEACSEPENSQSCTADGASVLVCEAGTYTSTSCDTICADANPPPSKQKGFCSGEGGTVTCLCADGVGAECDASEPTTCNTQGQLEFCTSGRLTALNCSTSCADNGYPAAGPCVDDPALGVADCICSDTVGSSCAPSEQFAEECTGASTLQICVDGTWYGKDCGAECNRQGSFGGDCQMIGGISSCVCE